MNQRRQINLTEWQPSSGHELMAPDISSLRGALRNLDVTPDDAGTSYTLRNASNEVGVVELDRFTVTINPSKCSPGLVVFMLGFSRNPTQFPWGLPSLDNAPDVWEAMVLAYAHQLERALSLGPHRSYRVEEAALPTIRGRVRFDDQLRHHYRVVPPLEVQFDDYTEDITENRILKAALRLCHQLPLRSSSLRQRLRHLEALLANVADIDYDVRRIPDIVWTRLNEHLRTSVDLATLILRRSSVTLAAGSARAPGFLVDMASVFEDFVVAGLRSQLDLDQRTFPQGVASRLRLAPAIDLKPDFSWWSGDRCVAVGDVKYKATTAQGVLHPDLYQVLAYAVASQLDDATLIYARSRTGQTGDEATRTHHVPHADKLLHVEILDLDSGPQVALDELARIAGRLSHCARARTPSRADVVLV
jgi:5-methylcytosine-specific restriction enzyme subunit McrC